MSSHAPHRDVHEHGLADDCERCEQIAGDPFDHADAELFRRLVTRVDQQLPHRSANELAAMRRIQRTILEHEYLELRGRR